MIAKETKKINTRLELNSINAEIYDFLLEYKLFPHETYQKGSYYYAIFYLDGFFRTEKAIKCFNDMIARFLLSMNDLRVYTSNKLVFDDDIKPYKIKELQNLKSIPITQTNFNFNISKVQTTDDRIFWSLKAYFEFMISNNMIDYDRLFNYAITNFKDKAKDFSTLKAKCRSIWNWYQDRDFKTTKYKRKLTDKEYYMTRSENMKKINKEKFEINRKNIINICTGLLKDEYKHKSSGNWNAKKIGNALKINEKTIRTHLKALQDEKII